MTPHRAAVVVGVGNPTGGDDGAGPAVARRVATLRPATVTAVVETRDPVVLLDLMTGGVEMVVVDACCSGAPPGTVHRLDAAATRVGQTPGLGSSHGLGLAYVLELARTLDRLPETLLLYAIEIATCEPGAQMSPEVATAVEAVAREIAG